MLEQQREATASLVIACSVQLLTKYSSPEISVQGLPAHSLRGLPDNSLPNDLDELLTPTLSRRERAIERSNLHEHLLRWDVGCEDRRLLDTRLREAVLSCIRLQQPSIPPRSLSPPPTREIVCDGLQGSQPSALGLGCGVGSLSAPSLTARSPSPAGRGKGEGLPSMSASPIFSHALSEGLEKRRV